MAKKPLYPANTFIDYNQGLFDENVEEAGRGLKFLSTYDTPDKRRRLYNSKMSGIMESTFGSSPFKKMETEDNIVQYEFDEKAKPLKYNEEDTFEEEAKKDLYNSLVKFKGDLPENSFLERTFSHSMTGDWASLVGDAFDIGGSMRVTEEGIKYNGELLSLTNEENDVFSKAIARYNADDRDKSFAEKTAETFTSLMWDLPLMMLSGAASANIMKAGGEFARAAMKSKQIGYRVGTQLIQQGINFNILGLPQTVRSTQDYGIETGISEMWHNVQMGAFATMTGFAGRSTVKGAGAASKAIKESLRRNPALAEELGALGGSLGFGTGTSLMAGESWEDALSTGLAFMGTHLTNPRAYREVIRQMKQSNVVLRVSDKTKRNKVTSQDDYFVQDIDGNLHKIDANTFTTTGEIAKTSDAKIEVNDQNKADYKYLNEVESSSHKQFSELLGEERLAGGMKRLTNRWISEGTLSKAEYRSNKQLYDALAGQVVISAASEKIKSNSKIVLPESKEMNDAMINFNNEHQISYGQVKDFLLDNIREYSINPDKVLTRIKDVFNVSDVAGIKSARKEAISKETKGASDKQTEQRKGKTPLVEESLDPVKEISYKEEVAIVNDLTKLLDLGREAWVEENKLPANKLKFDKLMEKSDVKIETNIRPTNKEAGKVPSKEDTKQSEVQREDNKLGQEEKVVELMSVGKEQEAKLQEETDITRALSTGVESAIKRRFAELDITEPVSADKPLELKRFMSENTYRKDIAAIKKSGLTMGVDPSLIPAHVRVGAYHLENVIRSGIDKAKQYTEWSKEMIKDFGETVKPYLDRLWKDAQGRIVGSKTDETIDQKSSRIGDTTAPLNEKPYTMPMGRGNENKPLRNESAEALTNAYGEVLGREVENKTRESNMSRDELAMSVQKPKTLTENKDAVSGYTTTDQMLTEARTIDDFADVQNRKVLLTSMSNKIANLKGNMKNILKYTLPPVHFKDMSTKFKTIYESGENSKTLTTYNINRILKDNKFWNNNEKWNMLTDVNKDKMLEGMHRYSIERFSGEVGKDMTWKEFADYAKLNAQERSVLESMEQSVREAVRIMKDGHANLIADEGKFIENMDIKYLRDEYLETIPLDDRIAIDDKVRVAEGELRKTPKYLGKLKQIQYNPSKTDKIASEKKRVAGINKKFKRDLARTRDKAYKDAIQEYAARYPEEMKSLAEKHIEDRYEGWGDNFYYNMVRPTHPDIFIIDAMKESPSGKNVRYNTYAENETHKNKVIENLKDQGYTIEDSYQIKDRINDKTYKSSLTEAQLLELAAKGDIAYDNEIVQKLLDSVKKGVNVHSINRKYIPGMKFSEKEFLNQFNRFVREAVNSGIKPYEFRKMDMNFAEWKNQVTTDKTQYSIDEMKDIRGQLNYAQGYINQLKQPERTWMDAAKGAAMMYHVGGLKPSFTFLQMMQVVQTGIAQAKLGADKLGVEGVTEAYANSFPEMIKIGGALHALRSQVISIEDYVAKQGLPKEQAKLLAEKIYSMQQLEWADKITATGVTEQMSLTPEMDYGNKSRLQKGYQTLQNTMSVLGRAVEKMSRVQVASMLYDLGYKKGLKGEAMQDFLMDNIDKAMGEWGKGGRAPLLYKRSGEGTDNQVVHGFRKSWLTYKTYSFYNYGQYADMLKSKNYSAMWIKAMVGTGLHGITKFPIYASMYMLANLFMDDEENMGYLEYKFSEELDKALPGNVAGKVLTKGLSQLFGIDMSDTFGEEFPIVTDALANAWGNTMEDKTTNIVQGAPISFIKDIATGASGVIDYHWGNTVREKIPTDAEDEKYKRDFMKLTPVFVKNLFKAFTYAKDGIEIKGNVVKVREDITWKDLAFKAMSFKLAEESKGFEDAQYSPVQMIKNYRKQLRQISRQIGIIRRTEELDKQEKDDYIRTLLNKKIELNNKINEARRL